MIQFLKDSLREMKHVVWPTRKETTQHFYLVVLLLALFGAYLFVFSNIFSNIMFALKDMFGSKGTTNVSSSLSDEEIEALFSGEAKPEIKVETASGSADVSIVTEKTTPESASGSQK